MPDALSDPYSLTMDEIGHLEKYAVVLPRDVSQSHGDQVGAKIKDALF